MVNKLNKVCFVKQLKIKFKIMIYSRAIQTINFTSKKVSLIAQNDNKIKISTHVDNNKTTDCLFA